MNTNTTFIVKVTATESFKSQSATPPPTLCSIELGKINNEKIPQSTFLVWTQIFVPPVSQGYSFCPFIILPKSNILLWYM